MEKKNLSLRALYFLVVSLTLLFLAVPFGFAEGVNSVVSTGVLNGNNKAILAIAAMGAVAVSCIMSGYALAKIGSAAMGAMSEKPEIGGKAIVFLGMAEGIAIYGLIVAIMILNKI